MVFGISLCKGHDLPRPTRRAGLTRIHSYRWEAIVPSSMHLREVALKVPLFGANHRWYTPDTLAGGNTGHSCEVSSAEERKKEVCAASYYGYPIHRTATCETSWRMVRKQPDRGHFPNPLLRSLYSNRSGQQASVACACGNNETQKGQYQQATLPSPVLPRMQN